MGKLNNTFSKHIENIFEVFKENCLENDIEPNDKLLESVFDEMLYGNYTLYATSNYGEKSYVKKSSSKKSSPKKKDVYEWRFHPDNKKYSFSTNIKEDVYFIRINDNINKIIGTINEEGFQPLTDDDIELLVKLKLSYDTNVNF